MTYPGGKNGAGIFQRIISLQPPHDTYIEPFLGGGAVMRLKRPAALNIGVDLDPEVIRAWSATLLESSSPDPAGSAETRTGEEGGPGEETAGFRLPEVSPNTAMPSGTPRHHRSPETTIAAVAGDCRATLAPAQRRKVGTHAYLETPQAAYTRRQYLELASLELPREPGQFLFLPDDGIEYLKRRLKDRAFNSQTLVYADPPYLHSTRGRDDIYTCEMTDSQHAELLRVLKKLPCMVMLSGYWSPYYAKHLEGWNSISYEAPTRRGHKTEWLWFNFPEPVALHDYRYLGEDFRERERIKRKKARWVNRLARMPLLEKRALLSAIEGTR